MPPPSPELPELLPLYALDALALGEEPVPVGDHVKRRLLASIGAPGAAIARFAAEVAALFDVSVEAARGILARTDDAAAWKPMMPGIEHLVVAAGPACAGKVCTLVRIEPGTRFPRHRHLGEEVSLVLHGGAHMSDGRDLRAGETLTVGDETEHDFAVDADGDVCIVAFRSGVIVPVIPAR